MHLREDEPRPAPGGRAQPRGHAQHHDGAEQDQQRPARWPGRRTTGPATRPRRRALIARPRAAPRRGTRGCPPAGSSGHRHPPASRRCSAPRRRGPPAGPGGPPRPATPAPASPATMAAVAAALASAQVAAATLTVCHGPVRRQAGPGIHDVMQHPPGPPPLAAGDRRGRDRPAGQPDPLGRRRPGGPGWQARRVSHQDRPAAARRCPAGGDVAAQADQRSAGVPGGGLDGPGRAVGSQALGRGAQVEQHPGRQAQQRAVEPHRLPSRCRDRRGRRVRAGRVDGGEITVVAQRDEGARRPWGRPARRSSAAAVQRHPDGLGEPVAEHEQAAVGRGAARRSPSPAGTGSPADPARSGRHPPPPGPRQRAPAATPRAGRWCPARSRWATATVVSPV